MQIEPDDLGCLGLEVRIVRGQIAVESVRRQRVFSPDASDRHVRYLELRGELARAPVGRTIGGLALHCPLEDASLQPGTQDGGWLPRVATE